MKVKEEARKQKLAEQEAENQRKEIEKQAE
jgi:hypothetical protein